MVERLTTFAELLDKHRASFHWGLDRLADASDVPKTTLAGWRSRGKLPRDWQPVVRIAAALGLDDVQTNELLMAAHLPSLEKLNSSSLNEPDKRLLSQWSIVTSQSAQIALQRSQLPEEGKERSKFNFGTWSSTHKLSLFFVVTIVVVSSIGVAMLSLPRWQGRISLFTFLQLSLSSTTAGLLAGSSSSRTIQLVELSPDAQLHLELADSRIITTGGAIRVGVIVTVSFVIRNEGIEPVGIKQLRAGGRMDRSCTEENATKWSGLPVEFPAVANLVLQPGEEYHYRTSRQYPGAATYFIEPVIEDNEGHWGGFSPSSCIDLLVAR